MTDFVYSPENQICSLVLFPYSSVSKESPCNAGNLGSIPGLGRSPGEGEFHGVYSPQSCKELHTTE